MSLLKEEQTGVPPQEQVVIKTVAIPAAKTVDSESANSNADSLTCSHRRFALSSDRVLRAECHWVVQQMDVRTHSFAVHSSSTFVGLVVRSVQKRYSQFEELHTAVLSEMNGKGEQASFDCRSN